MKKTISSIALMAGILAMSSCSDFLDQESPSSMGQNNVYNSAYFTELRINRIVGDLMQDRSYSQDLAIVWNMNSDVELVDGLGDNASNTGSERGNMNYNLSPNWTRLNDTWKQLYATVEDCNDAIAGIRSSELLNSEKNSDRLAMRRYLGEALTLRALTYRDLTKFWGDVPMKLEPSQPGLSNAYLEKTDRDVILDQMMKDLEEATEYLPWADEVSGYTTERPTKGFAHALLAQLALTRAGYAIREQAKEGYETKPGYSDPAYPTQRPDAATRNALYKKAAEHCYAVISDNHHSLNPSFENEWHLINQLALDKNYHENLYEIPMGLNFASELGYTVGVRLNGITSKYGFNNSSGKMKVTAPLLYSYDKNDTRRDITCANFEIKEDAGVTKEMMLKNSPFGIYVGKWDPRKENAEWLQQNLKTTSKHMTGINPVIMRYSQVLLYYAEALNELAGPDGTFEECTLTARQALALVHTRAFADAHKADAQAYVDNIPANKDAFFNAIVDENAWEFAGEGYRKFDLIRWGILAEKIWEMKQSYINALSAGEYPETLYWKWADAAQTQIDMSSVTFYETGLTDDDALALGYCTVKTNETTGEQTKTVNKVDGFGKSSVDKTDDTQVYTNLPSISSGLVGKGNPYMGDNMGDGVAVKNRYIMPIGASTISASNGKLHNSYGYSD